MKNKIFYIVSALYIAGILTMAVHKAHWSVALGFLTTVVFVTYTIVGVLRDDRLEMKRMEAAFDRLKSKPTFKGIVGRTGALGIEPKEHV